MSSLDSIKAALESIILNPRYADVLALVKAARNGAIYGAKVRFPHALVMTLLFRSGTLEEKLKLVFKATRTHAKNLARFAVIYKATMIVLKHLGSHRGKEGPYDTFFSGLLGGYLVFGQRSPRTGKISSVNQQIVIYIFARVCLALARQAIKPEVGIIRSVDLEKKLRENAWPFFAAASWGTVMWIFRWYPDTIQSSLQSSMQYIYVDSNHWDSLRNFVWVNK